MSRYPQPELVPYQLNDPPVEPQTMPHYIPAGNFVINAELTTNPDEHAGWDNQEDGITWIAVNGLFQSTEQWRRFGRNLVVDGARADTDMSLFAFDDPLYYAQSSYSESAAAAARYVRERAPEHRIILLGYSRGGISAAQIAPELIDEGVVDAVYTMAAPAGRIDVDVRGVAGVVSDLARSPKRSHDNETTRLARSLSRAAGLRLLLHPVGTASEVLEVCDTADTGARLAALSNRTGNRVPMAAAYYSDDGVVDASRHRNYLTLANYTAPVSERPGYHMQPLVCDETRAMLIERARHDVLHAEEAA
jgi:pimeloyl-ACP methyl ester carboxylesterase